MSLLSSRFTAQHTNLTVIVNFSSGFGYFQTSTVSGYINVSLGAIVTNNDCGSPTYSELESIFPFYLLPLNLPDYYTIVEGSSASSIAELECYQYALDDDAPIGLPSTVYLSALGDFYLPCGIESDWGTFNFDMITTTANISNPCSGTLMESSSNSSLNSLNQNWLSSVTCSYSNNCWEWNDLFDMDRWLNHIREPPQQYAIFILIGFVVFLIFCCCCCCQDDDQEAVVIDAGKSGQMVSFKSIGNLRVSQIQVKSASG